MYGHFEFGYFFVIMVVGTIFLLRKKIKYFIAPATVIKREKRNNILFGLHVVPSLIFALLIVLKVLPLLSYFAKKLDENSSIIPVLVILFFISFSFLIGLIIEKVMENNNPEFRKWKYKC